MQKLLSKPDRHFARCGDLACAVVERRVAGAPPFMRGVKALFVSDTHVLPRTRTEDIEALAAKIARLAPDILLLGGDYADRQADAVRLFEALKPLRFPLGAWGVRGNNDVEAWKDRPEGLEAAMADAGLKLLVNASARIPVNGGTLIVGGVDEYKFGAPRTAGLYPDEPAPGVYRILLSHYPVMPDAKPDLMIAGHTHGGQFNLLGLTPFAIGFERVFRPHIRTLAVSGLHEAGDMRLLVSKGVGASRIPWRVGARPEIDRITFL